MLDLCMNANYISGFFDADGYITVSKTAANEEAQPVIGFTNTVKKILVEIQRQIEKDTGLKGSIVMKTSKVENHSDSYDLKYVGVPKAVVLSSYLDILHPKKCKRLMMVLGLIKLTPRNGKYAPDQLDKRRDLCRKILEVK